MENDHRKTGTFALISQHPDIYKQSVEMQTELFKRGVSWHNTFADECCPDFSCCSHKSQDQSSGGESRYEKSLRLFDEWIKESTPEQIAEIIARHDTPSPKHLSLEECKDARQIVEETFKGLSNVIEDAELADWYRELIITCIEGYASQKNTGEWVREQTIKECQEVLLKQMFIMTHENGYPSQAVPHATILELPALMKLTKQ